VVGVGRTALFISTAEFQGGVGGTASLPDSELKERQKINRPDLFT